MTVLVELTLTLVKDVVTIIGVIAGFTYYVLTVRNANEAKRREFTRFLHQGTTSIEATHQYMDLLEMEWTDFEDFQRKYDSSVNRENYVLRASTFNSYKSLGYFLYKGDIDIESIFHLTGDGALILWNKFKPIIYEQRKQQNDPKLLYWFEYLCDELVKERPRHRKEAVVDASVLTRPVSKK